jgi:hypothetical protein
MTSIILEDQAGRHSEYSIHAYSLPKPKNTRVYEELDGPEVTMLGVRSRKLSNVGRKVYYLEHL